MKTPVPSTRVPVLSLALALGLSAGCASTQVSRQEILQHRQTALPAEVNRSGYEDALRELGRMVQARGLTNVKIHVNTGSEAASGGKVPDFFSGLMRTALAKTETLFVRTPHDGDIERAFRLGGASGALYGGSMPLFGWRTVESDLDLYVSVSGLDQVYGKGVDADADAAIPHNGNLWDVGVNAGALAEAQVITLDMAVAEYTSGDQQVTQVPGVYSSTSFILRKHKVEGGIGFMVEGKGMGFKAFREKTDGLHHALRLMAELSTIQVLGRYYRLPYWTLLPDQFREDDFVKRSLESNFAQVRSGSPEAFAGMLATLRDLHGLAPAAAGDGCDPVAEAVRLWLTVPVEQGLGKMRQRNLDRLAENHQRLQAAQAAPPPRPPLLRNSRLAIR